MIAGWIFQGIAVARRRPREFASLGTRLQNIFGWLIFCGNFLPRPGGLLAETDKADPLWRFLLQATSCGGVPSSLGAAASGSVGPFNRRGRSAESGIRCWAFAAAVSRERHCTPCAAVRHATFNYASSNPLESLPFCFDRAFSRVCDRKKCRSKCSKSETELGHKKQKKRISSFARALKEWKKPRAWTQTGI